MSADDVNEHIAQYVDGWDRHDPAAVMDAFAPGGSILDPTADEPRTGAEIGEWVEVAIEGFPDVYFEEHRLLATNEEGVYVFEWTMHGTHDGTFNGIPPTGNTLALDGADVITVSEEGIESIRLYFDQSSFADQLGLSFPAIVGQLPTLVAGAVRNAM